jgi:hypothetical protein
MAFAPLVDYVYSRIQVCHGLEGSCGSRDLGEPTCMFATDMDSLQRRTCHETPRSLEFMLNVLFLATT